MDVLIVDAADGEEPDADAREEEEGAAARAGTGRRAAVWKTGTVRSGEKRISRVTDRDTARAMRPESAREMREKIKMAGTAAAAVPAQKESVRPDPPSSVSDAAGRLSHQMRRSDRFLSAYRDCVPSGRSSEGQRD